MNKTEERYKFNTLWAKVNMAKDAEVQIQQPGGGSECGWVDTLQSIVARAL